MSNQTLSIPPASAAPEDANAVHLIAYFGRTGPEVRGSEYMMPAGLDAAGYAERIYQNLMAWGAHRRPASDADQKGYIVFRVHHGLADEVIELVNARWEPRSTA
jgi:hypothetical protein